MSERVDEQRAFRSRQLRLGAVGAPGHEVRALANPNVRQSSTVDADVGHRSSSSRVTEAGAEARPTVLGNAAENFAVLRHLALNLLKSVQGTKVGIRNRRLRAACDEEFVTRVLAAVPVAG